MPIDVKADELHAGVAQPVGLLERLVAGEAEHVAFQRRRQGDVITRVCFPQDPKASF